MSFSPCNNCNYCHNMMIGMKLLSGQFATGNFSLFLTLCIFKPALVWTISNFFFFFFVMSCREVTNLVLVDTWFGIRGDRSSSLN